MTARQSPIRPARRKPRDSASSLRLAYLSCDFGVPARGQSGKSVHLRETVAALARLGHEIEVFSPAVEPGSQPPEGVEMHPTAPSGVAGDVLEVLADELAEPPHLFKELRGIVSSEYVQRALWARLSTFRPQVIYERHALFSYAGLELARRLRVPLLLEVNAPLPLEQRKYRQLVLPRTAAEVERRVLTGADAVLAVSEALAEHVAALGVRRERITVLPNAADVERFSPAVSGREVRERYGLDGKRVVGFVGTLKPWHDLDTLLAACERLREQDPAVHLLVVGHGPRFDEVRERGGSGVTCVGEVAHERVPAFLAAMDVVVSPYAANGDHYFSPLKLFEAMAMGKPVVGARVGQVAEMVRDGENGVLYEPGDERDLAVRLAAVLDRPDWAAALGTAAGRFVRTRRTWDGNAATIASLARSLMDVDGRRRRAP